MIRIVHIMRELGRNLRRNVGTALASFLSLALMLLLFDLFWIAAGTSDQFYRGLLSEIRMEIFLDESLPEDAVTILRDQIDSLDGVVASEYVDRSIARARLADMVGTDLLVGYEDTNPLPRSFIVEVESIYLTAERLQLMADQLHQISGVDQVHYSRDWLDKTERAKRIIWQIGLILGGLILAAALVSSANNIRLMTRARGVGFRQMILQGAGRIFIALPFLLESFLISGLAAAFGWGVIWYGRTKVQFSQIEVIYPSIDDITLFCSAVALLGIISGYLGLRKLLRG